jgi:hypothetical protein
MLYALSTDDRTLHVFATEAEALSYCEGYDVSSGNWHFFAEDGSPLSAAFSEPAQEGRISISHGRYSLGPGTGPSLQESLTEIAAVEGPPGLQSVGEVALALARRGEGPL